MENEEKTTNVPYSEKWKLILINGVPTDYKISNYGNIVNYITDTKIKSKVGNNGYLMVAINMKKLRFLKSVHRLVAEAFIPIPNKYTEIGYTLKELVVNHKDANKTNNYVTNLEWVTTQENVQHAIDHDLTTNTTGENCHLAKMTREQAIQCCEMLEQGYSMSVIAKTVGVSYPSVQKIKYGLAWKGVAKPYKFDRGHSKYDSSKLTIPEVTVHEICKDLEKKCYSDYELAEKYGVSREHIRDIRTHKRRKKISKLYNF